MTFLKIETGEDTELEYFVLFPCGDKAWSTLLVLKTALLLRDVQIALCDNQSDHPLFDHY